MNEVVIYTQGYMSDECVFSSMDRYALQYVFEQKVVHLLGTEKSNAPFLIWANANKVAFRVPEVNYTKYGYSALQRVARSLFQNDEVKTLVVSHIDANSLEITHMAKVKGIEVITL